MKTPRNRLHLFPRGLLRCARNSRFDGPLFIVGARLTILRLPFRQQRIPVLSWQADSVPIQVIVKS